MTEIVLIRHGETDSNVKGTYLGCTDVPLNETGLKQAALAKDKLKQIEFDLCFASPLIRAFNTAKIILEGRNLKIHTDDRLKERNFGVWDDLTFDEITQKYPEEHKNWMADVTNYEVEGGESFRGSYERITMFADFLVKKCKDKRILIVTHSGTIRKIFAYLTGMGIEGVWRFKVDNASINKIEINDEGYVSIAALNA